MGRTSFLLLIPLLEHRDFLINTEHCLGACVPYWLSVFPEVIFNLFRDKILTVTLSSIEFFLPEELLIMPTAIG